MPLYLLEQPQRAFSAPKRTHELKRMHSPLSHLGSNSTFLSGKGGPFLVRSTLQSWPTMISRLKGSRKFSGLHSLKYIIMSLWSSQLVWSSDFIVMLLGPCHGDLTTMMIPGSAFFSQKRGNLWLRGTNGRLCSLIFNQCSLISIEQRIHIEVCIHIYSTNNPD